MKTNTYKINDLKNSNILENKNTISDDEIINNFINNFLVKYFLIKSNIILLKNNFIIQVYLNVLKNIFNEINDKEKLEIFYSFLEKINFYNELNKFFNNIKSEILFSKNELKKHSQKLKEIYYDIFNIIENNNIKTDSKKEKETYLLKLKEYSNIISKDLITLKNILEKIEKIINYNKNISNIKFIKENNDGKNIIYELTEILNSFIKEIDNF